MYLLVASYLLSSKNQNWSLPKRLPSKHNLLIRAPLLHNYPILAFNLSMIKRDLTDNFRGNKPFRQRGKFFVCTRRQLSLCEERDKKIPPKNIAKCLTQRTLKMSVDKGQLMYYLVENAPLIVIKCKVKSIGFWR